MISTRMSGTILVVAFAFTLAACSSGDSPIGSPSPPPPAGSATLTWVGPTTNADTPPTPLTDLAGYRVYQSTTSGSYIAGPVATVAAGTGTYTVAGLAAGTYYFTVRAYDTSGNESANALPSEVSKTIP